MSTVYRNIPCLHEASALVRGDRQQTHPYVNIMSAMEKSRVRVSGNVHVALLF